jgi:hypothetical protein
VEKPLVPLISSRYNRINGTLLIFIEVTDDTQNRANLMPARHSSPPVAQAQPVTEAEEKLKRPKRTGSAKRKNGLEHLLVEEIAPLTHPLAPPQSSVSNEPPDAVASAISPTNIPGDNLPTASPPIPDGVAPAEDNNTDKATAKSGVIVVDGIEFHHESEAEFARLLTYYGIEWLYEPHPFPLQWRDDRVIEMFTPDFYLVEYDFYIELTTMRQSLVRRKNRKLRLLRALYPEINIKLLYRRDYNRLLERFGMKPQDSELAQSSTAEAGE